MIKKNPLHIIGAAFLFGASLPAIAASLPAPRSEPVAAQEEAVLAAKLPPSLESYYNEGGRRIWTAGRRGKARLKGLLAAIERAEDYGLRPTDYAHEALMSTPWKRGDDALEAAASLAFTELALDVREGRLDPLIDWSEQSVAQREASRRDMLTLLEDKRSVGDLLKSLRMTNPVQAQLTKHLRRYERYAEEKAWSGITLSQDVVEQGAKGADVVEIRTRLVAEGFLEEPSTDRLLERLRGEADSEGASDAEGAAVYDGALAQAVERFQKSRGIVPDGVVGPATLARMNETPADLAAQIRLNLERARWLPQEFASRYLLVNIADFTVTGYADEKPEVTIRTVVGTDYNKTPVFADEMEYIVANPYWNIPNSILYEEIIPAQAKNPDYLASKNMEVVSGWGDDAPAVDPSAINWNDVPSDRSWRVRQRGGPSNALGLIKFIFPNDYAVYLHDSPAESLFDRTKRTFSHGCIRVEEPRKLAQWVLQGTEYSSAEDIDALISGGERQTVSLAKNLPVYITYFTVWTDEDGEAKFLGDVYDRDAPLRTALDADRENVAAKVSALLKTRG